MKTWNNTSSWVMKTKNDLTYELVSWEGMFLLISDLNLTFEESKNLQHEIDKLNLSGFSIRLKLLDHHGTGQKCANKFDWYYLDTSRSATKIVYDYLLTKTVAIVIVVHIIRQ